VIGARPDDHGSWLSGRYWRAGCPEFRKRVREQRYCEYDERRSERDSKRSGKDWEWRSDLDRRASGEGDQIHERRANETEIGNVLRRVLLTTGLRPACHGLGSSSQSID